MNNIQFKHQTCDDQKDAGWGCVFRSFQNAMLLHGRGIDFDDIVESYGEWTEPPKLRKYVPNGFRARTYLWFARPEALAKMRFTAPEDYDFIVPKHDLMNLLRKLAKTSSFIIDDGTFGYCLVYSNGWLLIDPHHDIQCKVASIASIDAFLKGRELWMIMAIERAKEAKTTLASPK